ncbi:MAG: hypothetical protein MPK62_00495 [Alphaproteobacteria bacterium]|nr:hypothetical protein [Alphaproteobacteria bacterium]MDA8029617.1 hypothetical protein [Alphaproteobacteria bacterium]
MSHIKSLLEIVPARHRDVAYNVLFQKLMDVAGHPPGGTRPYCLFCQDANCRYLKEVAG